MLPNAPQRKQNTSVAAALDGVNAFDAKGSRLWPIVDAAFTAVTRATAKGLYWRRCHTFASEESASNEHASRRHTPH